MRRLAPVLLLACMLGSASSVAQIYRWTDDRGRVYYGNVPSPGAAGIRQLDPRGALPSSSERNSLESRATRRREFPESATGRPSAFPSAVDDTTVASVGRALELRACERRPPHCRHAATVAIAPALSPLSALSAP